MSQTCLVSSKDYLRGLDFDKERSGNSILVVCELLLSGLTLK